jgi:hypothetical protein
VPACENFTVLGYSTAPNYDPTIHTVRVNIFRNVTYVQGVEFDLAKAIGEAIERYTPYKVVGLDCTADTEITGTIQFVTKNLILMNTANEIRQGESVMLVEVQWKDLRTGKYLSTPQRRPGEPPPLEGREILPDGRPGLPVEIETVPPSLESPGVQPKPGTLSVAPSPPTPPGGVFNGPAPITPLPGNVPPGSLVPGLSPYGPNNPLTKYSLQIRSVKAFTPELGQSISSAHWDNVRDVAKQLVGFMENPW